VFRGKGKGENRQTAEEHKAGGTWHKGGEERIAVRKDQRECAGDKKHIGKKRE